MPPTNKIKDKGIFYKFILFYLFIILNDVKDFFPKILEFHKFVMNSLKETCFELGQIMKMDKVPVIFDAAFTIFPLIFAAKIL